jgi:hypothetical protein
MEVPGGSPDLLRGMAGNDRDTLAASPDLVRRLDEGRIRGRLVLREEGPGLLLSVDVDAAPGHRVRVTYGPGLAPVGFTGPAGGAPGLRVSGDAVSFGIGKSGRNEIRFERTGKPLSPIKIQFHNEGELVAEHNLAAGSGRP